MELFIVEFKLRGKSPVTVEDGDVIVDKRCSTVTVRNVEADSTDDAREKARPKAEGLLDELCWQNDVKLEIGNSDTVMKQDSPTTRHTKFMIEVCAKGGHRKKIPRVLDKVEIRPSDSKKYYRKAAISEDPFDKFRNLYLAIENVASKIAAAKGKNFGYGQELGLLKFALQECFSSDKKLLEEHSHAYGFKNTGDILLDVATHLYKKNRVQLSHSKAGEEKKVPFNPDDEREVEGALYVAEFVAGSLISYEDSNIL